MTRGTRRAGNLRSVALGTITKGLYAQGYTEVTVPLSSGYKTIGDCLRLSEFSFFFFITVGVQYYFIYYFSFKRTA